MIIVMKQNAPLAEIERLEAELTEKGFQVDRSKGSSKVVLGLVGDTSALDERDFLSNEWVDKVMRVQEPYKRASRAFHPQDSIIDVFGAHEPFFDGGGHASFQQYRHMETAYCFQKVEVLHISSTNLNEVHFLFQEHPNLIGAHQLRHDRQFHIVSSGNQHIQSFFAQPLEGVWRGSWFERTTTEHGRTGLLDCTGNNVHLFWGLNGARAGHNHQFLSAHFNAAHINY